MIGLQLFRNINNLSLTELSEKIGVSRQLVNQWESKNKNISKERLIQLENIFNVPKELLIKDITQDLIQLIISESIKVIDRQTVYKVLKTNDRPILFHETKDSHNYVYCIDL